MEPQRCPYCGMMPLQVVHVHGHGQCVSCGTNVEPCCSGEGLENVPSHDSNCSNKEND